MDFDNHEVNYPGYIWQAILDRCKNVDEAIEIIYKYRLPELSESHIVLADASGKAVLIGVENNRMTIQTITDQRLLQTNFNPWHPDLSEEPICKRYATATSYLEQHNEVTLANMVEVLKKTHQDSMTVYSNIYDLKNKTIYTYSRLHFDKPIEARIPDIFQYGNCMIQLSELEADSEAWKTCRPRALATHLEGYIVDQHSGIPVPYANIGIEQKKYWDTE
ncbi:MAG: hypothetical protein HC811_10360 [Flammeovirgaceae bacterium]|nr:hypothetical protein [Flammeovirgaceae bacterium]